MNKSKKKQIIEENVENLGYLIYSEDKSLSYCYPKYLYKD